MLLLCVISSVVSAQSETIINSLSKNDIATFCNYFDNEIRISIPQSEGNFTKEVARKRISDFFDNNHLVQFSIIHKGIKNKDEYIIGKIETKNKNYRIQILIRDTKTKPIIQQIRIN